MTIRDLTPADLDWVLEINLEHEHLLSPLDRDALARLVEIAALARVIEGEAFLLAMDSAAPHESWNFAWFVPRYPRFLYVDRVAVASRAAGGGQGKLLYADMLAQARRRGYPMVCAEVNSDPPNDASLAFHLKQGFDVDGEAAMPWGQKRVRYFVRDL